MSPLLLAMSLAHAATCTVQSSASAGPGTLRRCINDLQANATTGDTILVDVARTILPVTALPDLIEDGLTIDGAGLLTLDGSLAPSGNGLTIVGADGVAIVGVQVVGFPGAGIDIQGGPNTVIGGTGADENALIGNDLAGIRVGPSGLATSAGTIVGGNRIGLRFDDSADGNCVAPGAFDCAGVLVLADAGAVSLTDNVISGNLGDGVRLHADNGTVHSNVIGVSASGTLDRGNTGDGIVVSGALIPGTGVDYADSANIAYNLVSGNGGHGVHLAAFSRTAGVGANGIGVDIAGAPLGNDSNGVHIASLTSGHSVTGTLLAPQVIGANGASGVVVGGHGHIVAGNHVGVTATPTPASVGNAAYGIRVASGSALGAHQVGQAGAGNVVAGNDLGGIWVDAPHTLVSHNIVGLGGNEATVLPNGVNLAQATSNVFGGIWVTAPLASLGSAPPAILNNLVAGNDGHGIWVEGGHHPTWPEGITIDSNDVGVDGTGAGAGNDGDGIRIEGASTTEVLRCLVAGNTGAGVHVLSTPTHASVGFTLADNDIGHTAPGPAALGNDGDGVWLEVPSGYAHVSGGLVSGNTIAFNHGLGLMSTGEAKNNETSANDYLDNGMCALRGDSDANKGDAWKPPRLLLEAGTLQITLHDQNVGTVDRVEVYRDAYPDDTENTALYVGDATVDPTDPYAYTWSPAVGVETQEYRALVIDTMGNTSSLTPVAGDGCVPDSCEPNPKTDWCSFSHWDGTQCITINRPPNYPCDDGDVMTGQLSYGDDRDLVGDICDGSGTCVGGVFDNDAQSACPFATDCNEATLDVSRNLCTYGPQADTSDTGFMSCGPDDLDAHDDGSCIARTECEELVNAAAGDQDQDGIPDKWEDGQWDWDCDPTTPDTTPDLESAEADMNVYLLLAFMSESCPTTTPAPPGFWANLHHHKPSDAKLAEMEAAFAAQSRVLTIETLCIPHYTQIALGRDAKPRDPDCNATDDFIYFNDLKSMYFEPWRRGIFHFGVMGHGSHDADLTRAQEADAECATIGTRAGDGEIFGDDFRIFAQKGIDYHLNPNASPDHEAETESVFHEIGHNFDLEHGGGGGTNEKPNYQSRMNYRYKNLRVDADADQDTAKDTGDINLLDYSRADEDAIDENALSETTSFFTSKMPPAELRMMSWTCPDGSTDQVWPDGDPIDWNCDGVLVGGSYSQSINGDNSIGTLRGYDDWAGIRTDLYCGGGEDWDDVAAEALDAPRAAFDTIVAVGVEVAPGCPSHSVSIDDDFPIAAVLWGRADVDVSTVILPSVRLAGGEPRRVAISDEDNDGYDDLRMWFLPSSMTLLDLASAHMVFNATTADATLFHSRPHVDPGDWGDIDGDGIIDPCD